MEQIEKIQGRNGERVHKSFSRAVLQPEFMAGVGRSDDGNGLHTGEFG